MSTEHSLLSGARDNSVQITIVTILVAMVLISTLFAMPRPSMISSQPWKVEFFSSFLLLGLVLWIFKQMHAAELAVPLPLLTLLLGFMAWSGLSAVWAQFPLLTAHHTLVWGIYLSFFVIFLPLLQHGPGFRLITGAFALIALVLGVLCLFDHLTVTDFAAVEGPIRIRYGKFAELLVTITPFLWVMAIYARGRQNRWLLALAGAFAWITIMLSLSKGAFLAGVLGSLVFFAGSAFFSTNVLRRKILIMAALWVVLTVLFQVVFSAVSSTPATTDYLTGRSDKTRSTTVMRLFTWRVSRQMIMEHPLFGVGADNFGTAFNEARTGVASRDIANREPEIAEDYIVERSHNEFLQVFAELGVVGFVLFAGAFGMFAVMVAGAFRRNGYRLPAVLWACVAGMTAFFVSSCVSSFSFRAAENGIAFFLIFAVGVNEISKLGRRAAATPMPRRLTMWLSLLAAGSMLFYSSTKAAGQYCLYRAERAENYETAQSYGTASLWLDPGNAAAYYGLASRHIKEQDMSGAAQLLSKGIDRGLGVSLTYSFLAKYQMLSGDAGGAEQTLEKSVKIFPNSTFLRVRYATFLETLGKDAEAQQQMDRADSIDARQAIGWYRIIKDGSVNAFYAAKADTSIAEPAELKPESAVLDYLDKMNFPADIADGQVQD